MTTFEPYRGFRIEVDQHGHFVAEVGTETCRAESMDGIRRSIDAEMQIRAEDPVSILVVPFDSGHVLPHRDARPETVLWHSVDYNYLSFKGSDPGTGEKADGYDRVVRADTKIGKRVIKLKRRLRSAYGEYRKLEKEYEALEEQHGLRPPDSGDAWDFDRLAAQGWMVAHLNDTT